MMHPPGRDRSYGIIPIRVLEAQLKFFLVQHRKGHWAFPKGHPEAGEDAQQTALRELKEETGLDAEIVRDAPVFEERYSFAADGRRVQKTVEYFIGLIPPQEVRIQDNEIRDYSWLSFEGALRRVTFPEGRQILEEAKRYLDKHPA